MSTAAAGDHETGRRRRWLGLALVALLVAGAAFAAGRLTAFGVLEGPNAADIGFARDMQVHHAQAVEMAMIEYRATDDDELRYTAYDIATGQGAQNGEMYGWLVAWGVPQYSDQPLMQWMQGSDHDHGGAVTESATDQELRDAMGMATDAQIAELQQLAGTVAGDCLFVELMIGHHVGALEMAEAIQELGADPRVNRVAGNMYDTQKREIDALTEIGERLSCG